MQNNTSGTLTVYQAAGSSGTIGTVSGTSGGTIVLEGDPTSTTAITNNTLATAGLNVKFNGGTWNLNVGGGYQANLEVDSGMVTVNASTAGGDFNYIESLTVRGGTLNSANTYGMRMGSGYDAGNNSGVNFTGIQTGGLVTVASNGGNAGISYGPCLGSIHQRRQCCLHTQRRDLSRDQPQPAPGPRRRYVRHRHDHVYLVRQRRAD